MVRRGEVSLKLRYFADPNLNSFPDRYRRKGSRWSVLPNMNGGGKRLRDPGQLRADQWFSLPMTRHHDLFAYLVARQLASAGMVNDVPVMTIDSMTAQKRLIEAGIGIALLPEKSIHGGIAA